MASIEHDLFIEEWQATPTKVMHMLKGHGISDEDRKRPMHYFYGARALEEVPFLDNFGG